VLFSRYNELFVESRKIFSVYVNLVWPGGVTVRALDYRLEGGRGTVYTAVCLFASLFVCTLASKTVK